MHHQGLLEITGNPDLPDLPDGDPGGLKFTNEHGIAIEATGRPTPPRPDDVPPYEPYQSPTGEHLQKWWVHFNKTDPPGTKPSGTETPGTKQPRFDPSMPAQREPDHAKHDRLDRYNREPAA